jgi:hypothetical protein
LVNKRFSAFPLPLFVAGSFSLPSFFVAGLFRYKFLPEDRSSGRFRNHQRPSARRDPDPDVSDRSVQQNSGADALRERKTRQLSRR